MDAPPPIGTRIRRARERLHWSQDQLAAAVGVADRTVRNWESGKAYPRNRIGALEAVLGISLSEDEEPDPGPQDEDQLDLIERMEALLESARRRQQRRQGGEPNARLRRTGT